MENGEDFKEKVDELRSDVINLRESLAKLFNSGFKRKTLIMLIAKSANASQLDTSRVISAIERFEEDYFED